MIVGIGWIRVVFCGSDSNKGIVSLALEPYKPLTQAMSELNHQVYSLADYFDQRPREPK